MNPENPPGTIINHTNPPGPASNHHHHHRQSHQLQTASSVWISCTYVSFYHRLSEEQFKPVFERILAINKEGSEDLLKSIGEERMRWVNIFRSLDIFYRIAGCLLDVSKDGYYNTEFCLEDFENVSFAF